MSKPIYMFGKQIGVVNDKRQFVSHKSERNFFRIYNGFGISVSILKLLKSMGVREIIIIYDHNRIKKKLIATPNDFFERGIRHQYKGFDIHMVLPLNCFNQDSLNKFIEVET